MMLPRKLVSTRVALELYFFVQRWHPSSLAHWIARIGAARRAAGREGPLVHAGAIVGAGVGGMGSARRLANSKGTGASPSLP